VLHGIVENTLPIDKIVAGTSGRLLWSWLGRIDVSPAFPLLLPTYNGLGYVSPFLKRAQENDEWSRLLPLLSNIGEDKTIIRE